MVVVMLNGKAYKTKEITLKAKEIEFDMDGKKELFTDAKGKKVTKRQMQAGEYKWFYDDGTEFLEKSYKCIKGKPVKEFSKTQIIEKPDAINDTDVKYLCVAEHSYLLCSPELKEAMKQMPGKVLKFKYVIRGFKIYKHAIIQLMPELDKLIMTLYRVDLREMTLDDDSTESEIESKDDGVGKLDLEAL